MQGNFTFLADSGLKKQAAELEAALCVPLKSDMQAEAIAFQLAYFWQSYQKAKSAVWGKARKFGTAQTLKKIRQAETLAAPDAQAQKLLEQAALCELEGCTKEQLLHAAAEVHRCMHASAPNVPSVTGAPQASAFDPKIYSLKERRRADDIRAFELPELSDARTAAFKALQNDASMQKAAQFFDRHGLRDKVEGELEELLDGIQKDCEQKFPYSEEQQNLEYYQRLAPRQFIEEMQLEQQHSGSSWAQMPEESRRAWHTERERWQQDWQSEWQKQQKQRIKQAKKDEKQRKKQEKLRKAENLTFAEQLALAEKQRTLEETQKAEAQKEPPKPGLQQLLQSVKLPQQQLLQNFMLKKWFAAFARKREQWLQEQIDAARKKFLAQLQRQMEQFEKLRQMLAPFGEGLGRLWDMSKGDLKNINWEVLQYYEQLFAQEQSLKQLADLLGRYRKAEHTYEKRLIEITREIPGSEPKYGQGGQRIGLEYGNKLSRVVPRELLTLADAESELLFLLKYSQKRLLQYRTMLPIATTEHVKSQKEEQYAKEENDQGPFILCVDTSGSMHGLPEQTAKMLCYVLARHAAQSKRKLFLINFSSGIDCVDLSNINYSLKSLVDFLSMSFGGGTDISPAMRKALEMMHSKNYKKADLLLISDGLFPSLDQSERALLQKQKDNGSKFYSLMIGSSAIESSLQIFDENWQYNHGDSYEKLVEKMRISLRKSVIPKETQEKAEAPLAGDAPNAWDAERSTA